MATPGTAGSGPGTTGGAPPSQWPAQVTDTIVGVVGKVRDATTVRVETAARALVYGTIAGTLLGVALVLAAVVAIRMLEVYLPVGGVWLPYAIVGGLFSVIGAFLLFAKTRPRSAKDPKP